MSWWHIHGVAYNVGVTGSAISKMLKRADCRRPELGDSYTRNISEFTSRQIRFVDDAWSGGIDRGKWVGLYVPTARNLVNHGKMRDGGGGSAGAGGEDSGAVTGGTPSVTTGVTA